ncbi:acyl-CoA thioesterase [bacterium]|nr:acyl-CoA thioesterase [bacterium]
MKVYQQITLLPKDTNGYGTVFGGVIMSYIDLAAAACCRDHFRNPKFVTLVVRELTFREPVYVGDLLTLSGEIKGTGRTSVTVHIKAEARRRDAREQVHVTDAEMVFVAVDEHDRKSPLVPWEADACG